MIFQLATQMCCKETVQFHNESKLRSIKNVVLVENKTRLTNSSVTDLVRGMFPRAWTWNIFLLKYTRADPVLKEHSGKNMMTKVRHLKNGWEQTVQMILKWGKRQGRDHEGGLSSWSDALSSRGGLTNREREKTRLTAVDKGVKRSESGGQERGKRQAKGSQAALMHRRGRGASE